MDLPGGWGGGGRGRASPQAPRGLRGTFFWYSSHIFCPRVSEKTSLYYFNVKEIKPGARRWGFVLWGQQSVVSNPRYSLKVHVFCTRAHVKKCLSCPKMLFGITSVQRRNLYCLIVSITGDHILSPHKVGIKPNSSAPQPGLFDKVWMGIWTNPPGSMGIVP